MSIHPALPKLVLPVLLALATLPGEAAAFMIHGAITSTGAVLEPVWSVDHLAGEAPAPGPYTLAFLDGAGTVLHAVPFADHAHGVVYDREVSQSQEVELDEARLFDVLHRVLGHDFLVLTPVERHVFDDGPIRHDDARGMGGSVARETFQSQRRFEKLAHLRVLPLHLAKPRLDLERASERHAQGRRDELCDPVHLVIGHRDGPAHVADGRARLQGPEGGDLRHAVLAVLFGDVAQHVLPAVHAKIDVDVGHTDAFVVQEPLEDEAVLDGIEVRDLHRVRNEAPGRRTSSRTDRDPAIFRVVDEIRNDQEIGRKPHFLDDAKLIVGPLLVFPQVLVGKAGPLSPNRGDSFREPLAHEFLEMVVRGFPCVEGKDGKMVLAKPHIEVAHFGHRQSVGERLRNVGEVVRHFVG